MAQQAAEKTLAADASSVAQAFSFNRLGSFEDGNVRGRTEQGHHPSSSEPDKENVSLSRLGETREQRCGVHKTANVLNVLPKGKRGKAKGMLHDIWMAETRAEAERAFGLFIATYEAKYPKATACLAKDREVLLTFYDFPAEHWGHLRTTNPIESTFATVRLRTARTKGCGSRMATLTMVFRLVQCAEQRWRALHRSKLLADVIRGVRFVDGLRKDAA